MTVDGGFDGRHVVEISTREIGALASAQTREQNEAFVERAEGSVPRKSGP